MAFPSAPDAPRLKNKQVRMPFLIRQLEEEPGFGDPGRGGVLGGTEEKEAVLLSRMVGFSGYIRHFSSPPHASNYKAALFRRKALQRAAARRLLRRQEDWDWDWGA